MSETKEDINSTDTKLEEQSMITSQSMIQSQSICYIYPQSLLTNETVKMEAHYYPFNIKNIFGTTKRILF